MTISDEDKKPSYWNYRIIEYKDEMGFGLHEVHYNHVGKPIGRTMRPIISCDTDEGPEGIIASLRMALNSVETTPVLKDEEP